MCWVPFSAILCDQKASKIGGYSKGIMAIGPTSLPLGNLLHAWEAG
jgi:hypothetical protein